MQLFQSLKLKIQMKKIILLLAISLVFASCKNNKKESAPSDAVETVTITHSQGTTDVPLKPQRLVVLDFAALERSEEHTSELQSRPHLVCRLLLEKNKYASC